MSSAPSAVWWLGYASSTDGWYFEAPTPRSTLATLTIEVPHLTIEVADLTFEVPDLTIEVPDLTISVDERCRPILGLFTATANTPNPLRPLKRSDELPHYRGRESPKSGTP
jgi:hypothetical protein